MSTGDLCLEVHTAPVRRMEGDGKGGSRDRHRDRENQAQGQRQREMINADAMFQ